MSNEEAKALEALLHDLKEHNTSYDKDYEDKCVSAICKLEQENKFLRERENKLQTIEQMFKNGFVDLSKLNRLVNKDIQNQKAEDIIDKINCSLR